MKTDNASAGLAPASGSALSGAQRELVDLMRAGKRLMWWGDSGPEIEGRPFWPQKRTVRALIARGVLKWGEYNNETQRQSGFCPVVLNK